jgi:release factor glutamine methyltransferase
VTLAPARGATARPAIVRTVAALRREVARTIGASSPTAALDARMMLAHLLHCVPEQLPLRDEETVEDMLAAEAMALGARRAAGEPVARIVGEKEFHGLMFALSSETLVPRPDTETLVDAALAVIAEEWSLNATLNILDLGTGSGAILIALLTELPNSRGQGVDISAGAVATARENAARHGVAGRAAFAVGDWTQTTRARFEVVVANPPYIETAAIAGLQIEVRDHDPHLALDGGADGFDAIHVIVAGLGRVLADGGVAFIEIGAGQADTVSGLAEAHGFACGFRRDLAGVDRVAVLSRQSEAEANRREGRG